MSLTYKACKIIINKNKYKTKEDMLEKLNIFLLNDSISQEEYNELILLLEA